MTLVTARPFPWAKLPRVSGAASKALVGLRTMLAPGSAPARILQALETLVGTPIVVAPDTFGPARHVTLASDAVAIRLEAPATADGSGAWSALLEVDPALVVAVVARVTKRPAPQVVVAGAPSASVVGAFLAIVAAASRHAGIPVIASVVRPPLLQDANATDASAASFTVFAGDQATPLRAFFSGGLLRGAPPPFDAPALATLGGLSLDLPLIACLVVATTADVAALAEGDAWMLGESWNLGRLDAPLAGPVWLAAGPAEVALAASLEADGRVVLRDGVEELGWSPMSDETRESGAVAEAVGEVQVVVRVEIGSARMKAKEWSALATGDVVALGSKVGGTVVLRVSGVAVAEGELVDVDGEVGVRIKRRLLGSSK